MQRSLHRGWIPRNLYTALGLMLLMVLASACTPPSAQTPPADAQDACSLTPATFASWFQTGTITANGVVNPADSLATLIPNCGFYQWAEQMFMWLNSPAPATYGGGGGRIFDSPVFFDVSPPQPDHSRIFIPHVAGVNRLFGVRVAQVGARGLPVILDQAGRMLEIERPEPGAKPLVRNVAGQLVEIAHARLEKNGNPILLDTAGKVIESSVAEGAQAAARSQGSTIVRQFVIDKIPIFLNLSGALVPVEQGQADGGVLEAQNGSLIYYATIVNDVYAYFATGAKDGGITPAPSQFPTSPQELSQITAFASTHGKTFPDPNALAIEVKSSWIEAAGLANLSSYITMTATIPTYDTSNLNQWTPNGQKTVQLALVGMHVVGSTAGHPEMVWATFEHLSNSPNATYTYNGTTGTNPKTVAQGAAGTWLFSASNPTGPFNVMHMQQPFNTLNIIPIPTNAISPSDTMRSEPWGMPGTNAGSNTEVISMNNNVRGMIPSGDVRSNYIMTGATWTIGGADPGLGGQVGTNQLANTTMETYQQGQNCFDCHVTNTTGVSHVFGPLKPLF